VTALLRGVILATAIAQLARGGAERRIERIAALGVTLLPAIRTHAWLPLALLSLMVVDMTLGNTLGLYARLPWLDKALHVATSALLTTVALHALRRSPAWLAVVASILVAVGIGAVWEIAEYGIDQVLARQTQRSPGLSALDDTMLDLAVGLAGAVAGALLALAHTRRDLRRPHPVGIGYARPGVVS